MNRAKITLDTETGINYLSIMGSLTMLLDVD